MNRYLLFAILSLVSVAFVGCQPTFDLNISIIGTGTTDPPPGITKCVQGTSISIYAVQQAMWVFDHWEGDIGTANPTAPGVNILMDANKSVTAVFVEADLTLTVNTQGQAGVTQPSGTTWYRNGQMATLTATEQGQWVFDHWEGDIGTANPTSMSINIAMDSNKTVTAVFTQADWTLTVGRQGDAGSTQPSGTSWYLDGETVTVSAFGESVWTFDHWEGDIGAANPQSSPLALVMDANKTVTAVFTLCDWALTLTQTGSGAVNPGQMNSCWKDGDVVTLVAQALGLGWYFDHWAGDIGTADAASPTLSLTMRSDRSVNAVFVQGDIPLVVAVEGGGRVAPAPGTYWMRQGESVYCHVYPSGRGAHFDHWEGDIGDAHPEDTNFVLVVDAPKNLTALFDPGDFVLTVKSTPSNMFVSPELGDWGYRNGDTVRVAAGIAPGRLFAGWQGDLISANYTEYLVMDSDKTITATFETAPNEKLVFPDNALEAYFRYAINKPTGDIYLNDCLDRGSLDAQWAGIYSLEGIQKLPWLGRCNAYSNNLTDITPLSAIVGMFASDVTGNQITDISPYSGLPFLSYLNVGGNKITDISGLKDLPDLRTFIAFDNLITDITALAAFPKLRELNLQGNPVASIAPLAGLFYLKSIRMPGCQADDLTPLAGHKQLEILVMTGSLISDLSPLEEDLALRDLALSQCQITDISALENLPNLKRVELNLNTIADLAPLVNNVSFGQGAQLFVEDNPLGPAACDQIAALKARGVFVQHSYLPACPK